MNDYVKELTALGLYQRLDLHQQFENGVNILYGRNGAGKTTILHILANVLNGDFQRFLHLNFRYIEVILSNGTTAQLTRRLDDQHNAEIEVKIDGPLPQSFTLKAPEPHDRRIRAFARQRMLELQETGRITEVDPATEEPVPAVLPAAYFPAFRTMMEAWTSMEEQSRSTRFQAHEVSVKATGFARKLFGSFVPSINYPSALDIEQRLASEFRNAMFTVARYDEELLSESFVQMFAALTRSVTEEVMPPEVILDEIRSLYDRSSESSIQPQGSQSVYARLQTMLGTLKFTGTPEITAVRILKVFRDALAKRAQIQEESFEVVNRYLDSLNEFLEGKRIDKKLTRRRPDPVIILEFADGVSSSLRALSSGERQIVTLIYAATHMNEQQVVLIDEPELSLHVDWQRKLLSRMSNQLGDRQIIACTHSPVIGADYEERRKQISPERSNGSDLTRDDQI